MLSVLCFDQSQLVSLLSAALTEVSWASAFFSSAAHISFQLAGVVPHRSPVNRAGSFSGEQFIALFVQKKGAQAFISKD